MSKEEKDIVVATKAVPMSKPLPMGEEAKSMHDWAIALKDTKYYTEMVNSGGKNALLAIFLAARDLDISPSQALHGGMYIVKGKVSLSAQMMNMMIRRHKHSLQKIEGNDTRCTWKGTRKDNGDTMTATFTIQQAQKAGLTNNPVWKNYPGRMLSNRALSFLARELFPDCIGNAYIEGEVEEADIETIEITQPERTEEDIKVEEFKKKFNLHDTTTDLYDYIEKMVTETRTFDDIIKMAIGREENFLEGYTQYVKKKKDGE